MDKMKFFGPENKPYVVRNAMFINPVLVHSLDSILVQTL